MSSNQKVPASASQVGDDYKNTIHVKASPDAVYDALTNSAGLSNWWARCTGNGDEGGELRFFMNAADPLVVRVTRASRPSIVEWTVTDCPFMTDWVGTRPTFSIAPAGQGESELRFVHYGLTPALDCIEVCTRGWNHFIPSLGAYVETGQGFPLGSSEDKERRRREAGA